MGRVRVAIVGAGLMGRWHARYAARAGAAVVAVIDPDPAAAARLAARSVAVAYPDLPTALAAGGLDAVHLCTPLGTHRPLAEAALAAGCHVLCEKPLAATRVETEYLLAVARRHDRRVCAVHQFGFQWGVRRLRADLPRLGDLVEVSYTTCSAGGAGRPDEARRAVLLEILPHPVALFLGLLGPAAGRLDWQVDQATADDLALSARLADTRLRVAISLRGRPTRNELSVVGTRGTATADLFHGYRVFEPGGVGRLRKVLLPFARSARVLAAAGGNLLGRAARREPAYPGLRELIAAFHAAVAGRGPVPVGPDELLAVAALIDRVRGDPVPATAGRSRPAPVASAPE